MLISFIVQEYIPLIKDSWDRLQLDCLIKSNLNDFYVSKGNKKCSFVLCYDIAFAGIPSFLLSLFIIISLFSLILKGFQLYADSVSDFNEGMKDVKLSSAKQLGETCQFVAINILVNALSYYYPLPFLLLLSLFLS